MPKSPMLMQVRQNKQLFFFVFLGKIKKITIKEKILTCILLFFGAMVIMEIISPCTAPDKRYI